MKFLHLGDLHLGKFLGDFDLKEDQKYILEQILDIIKNRSVDAVLIAGDVYDKSIPSEAATRLLDSFLKSLSQMGVSVYMISGNHDSDERLNFGSSLFEKNQIYISSVYRGSLYKRNVTDEYGELNIYLLPFVKASRVRHFLPEEKIESYEDAVRAIIQKAEIDSSKRNLILAHQFVTGKSEDPKMAGSESAAVKTVGMVEKIGCDVFDAFDYAALGHIHSPQKVGREEVRYCGSPLKYSLSEANNDKSVPLITMGEKGNLQIEQVALKPKRDLRHLTGPMALLLDRKNVTGAEDYIYATLTDEDIIPDAMGIFRQTYPNTVRIDYNNSHTKELEMVDISKIAKQKSFSDLISDFYSMIYGCPISEEEMKLMKEVAQEAGINEAN